MQAIIAATPGLAEERARCDTDAVEAVRAAAVAWSEQHPGVPLADGATALGLPERRLRRLLGERVGWHPPQRTVVRRYTDAQLLQHVRLWVLAQGPSAAGYRDAAHTRPGWPSLTTITGRFGSRRHALQAAGLSPAPARPGRSRVWSDDGLAGLVAGYLAETPTPSLREISGSGWLLIRPGHRCR